ncbi:MAG: hypothetical protein AB9861_10085 [Methanosarcina sp.]
MRTGKRGRGKRGRKRKKASTRRKKKRKKIMEVQRQIVSGVYRITEI